MRLLKPCTQGELILTKGGWIIDKKIGIVNDAQNWRRRRTLGEDSSSDQKKGINSHPYRERLCDWKG
jgi:hypothetical protein